MFSSEYQFKNILAQGKIRTPCGLPYLSCPQCKHIIQEDTVAILLLVDAGIVELFCSNECYYCFCLSNNMSVDPTSNNIFKNVVALQLDTCWDLPHWVYYTKNLYDIEEKEENVL